MDFVYRCDHLPARSGAASVSDQGLGLAFMALGILQVLLGLAAIFQPITAMTLVGLLVGGQLVLRGVDAILSALFFNFFYL